MPGSGAADVRHEPGGCHAVVAEAARRVEWSYQLLDENERRVFRAMAVFPAGFTLEAA